MHLDALSRPIEAEPAVPSGWTVDGGDLDDWLERHGGAPLAGRVPVLAYGSNRCPSKITWLREHLGLTGPVVVLRATVHGLAAVWAAGTRARDGVRPATLAAVSSAVETHAVWMATPEQIAVLDVCEGRGERYDLVRLRVGRAFTDDGALLDAPWAYWPAAPERAPLLVDGAPLRCVDVDEPTARRAVGRPATVPTDAIEVQYGAPDPRSWPTRVFAYGTLQPGQRAWPLMAAHAGLDPHSDAGTVPGRMHGRVHDTGRGYPALRLTPAGSDDGSDAGSDDGSDDADGRACGTIVPLVAPATSLDVLDEYEGPEYRRVRRVTYRDPDGDTSGNGPVSGSLCWVWVWIDANEAAAWPAVRGRWGA